MKKFTFQPHAGALPGLSFEAQTEDFLNKLGEEVDAASINAVEAQSSVAKAVSAAEAAQMASVIAQQAAQQAQSFADAAIKTAGVALQQAEAASASAHNAMTVAEDSLRVSLATQVAVQDLEFSMGEVQGNLAQKAPLLSPDFSGVPTAPTAGVGTNTAQLANTAFVQGEITRQTAPKAHVGATGDAHGVASSSADGFMSAADKVKLEGIASGAQPNAVTSVAGKTGAVNLTVSNISGAAPLASPALTGTPTVPTAKTGTNSTQAASTAFVQGEVTPLKTRIGVLEEFMDNISIFKA